MNNSSDQTQVTAIPVDSTSKVEIINPEKLPGNAKIKITSQFGYEREIDLVIYREPLDLYSLTNLKYYIGDTEYSIEDFDSKVTSYEVELKIIRVRQEVQLLLITMAIMYMML